jgi:hypothetical protein
MHAGTVHHDTMTQSRTPSLACSGRCDVEPWRWEVSCAGFSCLAGKHRGAARAPVRHHTDVPLLICYRTWPYARWSLGRDEVAGMRAHAPCRAFDRWVTPTRYNYVRKASNSARSLVRMRKVQLWILLSIAREFRRSIRSQGRWCLG